MDTPSKPALQKSETWMTLVAALTAMAVPLAEGFGDKIHVIISLIALAITVGTYTVFKTDLPSIKPGWTSKPFWSAVVIVIGSVALAISETTIAGVPPGVTKAAGIIAAAVTAAGYTLLRFSAKETQAQRLRK